MEGIAVALIGAAALVAVALIEHRSQRRQSTLEETESDAVKTTRTLEREIELQDRLIELQDREIRRLRARSRARRWEGYR